VLRASAALLDAVLVLDERADELRALYAEHRSVEA